MKCSDYEFQISIDSVGELDKKSKLQLEVHLKTCEGCKNVYDDSINLNQQLYKLYKTKIDSPDVVNSVLEAIIPKRKFSYRWAWAAAVIIFAVLISYSFILYPKKPVNTKPVLTASKPAISVTQKIVSIPTKAITKKAPKLIKNQIKLANSHKSLFKKKVQVAYKPPVCIEDIKVSVQYQFNDPNEENQGIALDDDNDTEFKYLVDSRIMEVKNIEIVDGDVVTKATYTQDKFDL